MSKSKVNARTVAAPVVVKPRDEYEAFASELAEKNQSLSQRCAEIAEYCRVNNATADELALIKAVVTKQQWADMNKIICCAHKLPASAPKSLVKRAQYIRALDKGATAAEARQHVDGKLPAPDLVAKIAKRKGEPVPAPKGKKAGAETHAAGNNALKQLHDAIEALRKDYGDAPAVLSIVGDLSDMYDDLLVATAAANQ